MKYVVYEGYGIMGKEEKFIVFPIMTNHSDFIHLNPVSAGFVRIESYENDFGDLRYRCDCSGESTTLKLKSRPQEDSALLSIGMGS